MSLKSVVSHPTFHECFRSSIRTPIAISDTTILAPPLTKNYALVGAAFDYLLRFYIARVNPEAHASQWVAEFAASQFISRPHLYDTAKRYVSEARRQFEGFLQSGIVTDELLRSSLRLAVLDGSFRSGSVGLDENTLVSPDPRDIADLQALISVVPEEEFKARTSCYLNPTFGAASAFVGGADGDLIIDNKLVEIKTTKTLILDPQIVHQLVGYYVLLSLGGVTSEGISYIDDVCTIDYLCIYYSRHGYLHVMRIADLIEPAAFPAFVDWFIRAVCPTTQERLEFCRQFYGEVPNKMLHDPGRGTAQRLETNLEVQA